MLESRCAACLHLRGVLSLSMLREASKINSEPITAGSIISVGGFSNEKFAVGRVLRGGMGIVYQTVPVRPIGRTMALKTYIDAADTAKFDREARLWISLGTHPNSAHLSLGRRVVTWGTSRWFCHVRHRPERRDRSQNGSASRHHWRTRQGSARGGTALRGVVSQGGAQFLSWGRAPNSLRRERAAVRGTLRPHNWLMNPWGVPLN